MANALSKTGAGKLAIPLTVVALGALVADLAINPPAPPAVEAAQFLLALVAAVLGFVMVFKNQGASEGSQTGEGGDAVIDLRDPAREVSGDSSLRFAPITLA